MELVHHVTINNKLYKTVLVESILILQCTVWKHQQYKRHAVQRGTACLSSTNSSATTTACLSTTSSSSTTGSSTISNKY